MAEKRSALLHALANTKPESKLLTVTSHTPTPSNDLTTPPTSVDPPPAKKIPNLLDVVIPKTTYAGTVKTGPENKEMVEDLLHVYSTRNK